MSFKSIFKNFTGSIVLLGLSNFGLAADFAVNPDTIVVKSTKDFEINGKGSAINWTDTDWIILPQRKINTVKSETKVKILYSGTGIYFLFECEDRKITATMNSDFMDLWKEDVVEVFLQTDANVPLYFEYEISPLNYELPILISNENKDLVRWQPFHYDSDRQTRQFTHINGGEKKSNDSITSWTAEFFIPYKLLRPLNNINPVKGSRWKINMYRVDYDNGMEFWAWKLTNGSFHEFEKFGTMKFE